MRSTGRRNPPQLHGRKARQLLDESLAEGQRLAALQEVNETAHREANEDNDDNEDNEDDDDNEDNEDNVGQDDLTPG